MKKSLVLVSTLVLSSILFACNSDSESNNENTQESNAEDSTEVNETETDEQSDDEDEDSDITSEADDNTENDPEGVLGDGEFEDQLELGIGETGNVETLIGRYSVTVNDVEILEDVEGEMSELDYYIKVNYTLENIGDDEIDSREAIDTMESVHELDRSGFRDNAPYMEGIEGIEGSLSPGDSVTGDAVYDAYESEENYLRITEGLVGSGAAKNQILFTFTKDEAQ